MIILRTKQSRCEVIPAQSDELSLSDQKEKLSPPDEKKLHKTNLSAQGNPKKCPHPLSNSTKCAAAVFIGGAMKCGTNEAMHLLTFHPRTRFSTCNPKDESCSPLTHQGCQDEVGNYFSWESEQLPIPEDFEAIEARLPDTDGMSTVNFDKSPRYMEVNIYPHLPKNMKMLMPGTKMAFSVCDPAERLVSEFHHLQKIKETEKLEWIAPNIRVPANFTEFVNIATGKANICSTENCDGAFLAKGEYATNIRKWLEVYDSSEILVLDMNEAAKEKAKKLLLFAGLPLEEYPWEKLELNEKTYENKAYSGRGAAWKEYSDEMCTLSKHYVKQNRALAQLLNQQYPLEWRSSTAVGRLCK